MEIKPTQVTTRLQTTMGLKECIVLDKQIFKEQAYSTIKWEWEVYPFKHKILEELQIFMEMHLLFKDNI
jgi:hypothetical protein